MNDVITVDGVSYRRITADGEQMRIVVVDNRGLTFVGSCNPYVEDEWIAIREARCIIRWGTTGHLAELCAGPLSQTKLGNREDVTVRRANIVAVYDCAEGAWA